MKHIDLLHQLDYSVYATFGVTTVLAGACATCPFLGQVARTVAWGAWLYLANTRG